ncbi:MAG: ankyrin repeat domain-containing protein [Acidobacteria bacterium]|nr:ankyrin repeat domain-containing protein [Acidobacteriota bacterium]
MAGRRISLLSLFVVLLPAATGVQAQELNEQLLAAARKSDAAAVKALLDKGADVNAKTRYGATALSFAADRGSVEVVKLLLERGAEVNVRDTFYSATPLTWAASKNHPEVTRMLLEKGAQTKEMALSIAVQSGHKETAEAVLSMGGFKPEALTPHLTIAMRGGHTEIVDMLKRAGAAPPVEYKIAPEKLKLYEGKYRNSEIEAAMTVTDGKLIAAFQGGQPLNLMATSENVFTAPEIPGIGFTFKLEADRVVSFTLKQGDGSERVFQRVEQKGGAQ